MANTFTVTVNKGYSFAIHEDTEETYGVKVTRLDNGDFEVSGEEDKLEIFADDICIGSRHDVSDIMRTIR